MFRGLAGWGWAEGYVGGVHHRHHVHSRTYDNGEHHYLYILQWFSVIFQQTVDTNLSPHNHMREFLSVSFIRIQCPTPFLTI